MPFNDSGLRALGVNAVNPPDAIFMNREPTQNDYIMHDVGKLWYVDYGTTPATWSLWYLASKANMIATWLKIFTGTGGNAITNLIDDNGNIVTPDLTTLGITIKGGANINTDGSVPHEIIVNLDTSIWQPNTTADQLNGVYGLGGIAFLHNYGTNNTFVGSGSGNFTLTVANAERNTALGSNTLAALTTGKGNSAGGASSLLLCSTGSYNTAFGGYCMGSCSGEGYNTAYGYDAGYSISTGTYNTSIGIGTMLVPTNSLTGSYNTVIGSYTYLAGINWTGAESSNIYIGHGVAGVVGESNVLRIGNATGVANGNLANDYIAGIYNTASGVAYLGAAPKMVAIGSDNKITSSPNIYMPVTTATEGQVIMNSAPLLHTFPNPSSYGATNLFLGLNCGNLTSLTAHGNTAVGNYCLSSMDNTLPPNEPEQNVAMGVLTMNNLTSGYYNTGIGTQVLEFLLTGNYNTCLGNESGYHYNGSESSNILIGAQVYGTTGESHTLQIGNATGIADGNINKTYICGIRATAATPTANALVTLVDTNDLLYGIANQTLGYVLTSNGPSNAPTWQVAGGGGGGGIVTLTGDTGSTVAAATIQIAGGNNITTAAAGGILTVNVSGTTNHAIQVGNASNSLTSLAVGTTGKYLRGATTANPTWSTLTLPDTVNKGDILIASANNVVDIVAGATTSGYVLTANGAGTAPTFQAIPASGVTSLNSLTGALSIVAGNNTTVTPAGSNITVGLSGTTQYCIQVGSSVGGITDLILGTSGAVLRSAGAGASPAWSVASYPYSTAANSILVSATSNAVTATTAPSISGTYTTTAGNFALPTTTSTAGQITINGSTVLHNYGAANNFFLGGAGNYTLTVGVATNNLGTGGSCMQNLTTGSSNCAYGVNSASVLTTGDHNCLYGPSSGSISFASGSYNSFYGASSGSSSITSGSYNSFFGASTGGSYSSNETSNILIGYGTTGNNGVSNQLKIGTATGTGNGEINICYICGITGKTSTSGAAVYCNSSNVLGTSTSSIRYKEDVTDMTDMSQIIASLRPVTFHFKEDTSPKPLQYGLIAEEVEPIWPEMVIYGPDGLPQNLAYQFLAPILLKEIQSLRKRIEMLEHTSVETR